MVATGRVVARFYRSYRITVDDGFFYLAITTLVAGTIVLYLDIPYIYLQENVEAGLRVAPDDLVLRLLQDERLQNATATLLGTTIASVKLSFMFFFRALIWQQKRLMVWWWCNLVLLVPTTAILMFSNFISCPYHNQEIIGRRLANPLFGLHLATNADPSS